MNNPKRVLMVSSEFAPFAKSGGLADAVASLSIALKRRGVDVRVVIPRYGFIQKSHLDAVPGSLGIPIGLREEWVAVYKQDGEVPVYLLDHEELFGRRGIYNESGLDYADNARRFTLLAYGAFQLCRMLHWNPDVIHAHDWPAGLVPVFLQSRERRGEFEKTASLFTIHNIGYQGIFSSEQFVHTKLPWEEYPRLDFQGSLNMLYGGLANADIISTVSPQYAKEIRQPPFSFGLEELLAEREDRLHGVLNGIDLDDWDPEEDSSLPAPYSSDDLSGKSEAKLELQRHFGLPESVETPVIGLIGRLADQKGIGYLFGESGGAVEQICRQEDVHLVLIGSGDPKYEQRIRETSLRLPNFGAFLGYDNDTAHLIEGGADFFLMPSEYEPCGLNQMYSMRYGTIPIVSGTGGLVDTVVDESKGAEATGFVIGRPSEERIVATVQRALYTYREMPERIVELRLTGMSKDFSWERSAETYLRLYEEASRLRSLS